MIEQIIITSLIVFGIYCTMQEGMIFGKFGIWIEKTLGEFWAKPVATCAVCMAMWYGTVIYLILYRVSVLDWFVTVVAAMGLNYVLVRMFNDD